MKVKRAKLVWNVLRFDSNQQKIVDYNIFGSRFANELHKEVTKKHITNLEELKEYIRRWAIYYYMSKCEFEIVVGGLFFKDETQLEKIDIYRQIYMNLDRITEYVNKELDIGLGG